MEVRFSTPPYYDSVVFIISMEHLFWENNGLLRDQWTYMSMPLAYPNLSPNQDSIKLWGYDTPITNGQPAYASNTGRTFTNLRSPLEYNTGNMTIFFVQKGNPTTDSPMMFSHLYDYCLSGGISCLLPGGYKPFSTNWSLTDGRWNICAMVIDSSATRIKAFRNGLKVQDIVNAGIIRNGSPTYLTHRTGADASASPLVTTALWSDIVIYQTILTDAQVLEVTNYYANRYNLTLEV